MEGTVKIDILDGRDQRKQQTRTLRQSALGSDLLRLVPVTGLEPVRCRQRWILSPLRLPIPSHRQVKRLYNGKRHFSSGQMQFFRRNDQKVFRQITVKAARGDSA